MTTFEDAGAYGFYDMRDGKHQPKTLFVLFYFYFFLFPQMSQLSQGRLDTERIANIR
jgi:hypothetical protein